MIWFLHFVHKSRGQRYWFTLLIGLAFIAEETKSKASETKKSTLMSKWGFVWGSKVRDNWFCELQFSQNLSSLGKTQDVFDDFVQYNQYRTGNGRAPTMSRDEDGEKINFQTCGRVLRFKA